MSVNPIWPTDQACTAHLYCWSGKNAWEWRNLFVFGITLPYFHLSWVCEILRISETMCIFVLGHSRLTYLGRYERHEHVVSSGSSICLPLPTWKTASFSVMTSAYVMFGSKILRTTKAQVPALGFTTIRCGKVTK